MAVVGRLFRLAVVMVLLVLMFAAGWGTGKLGYGSTVPVASLADGNGSSASAWRNRARRPLHRGRPPAARG